MKNYSFYLFLIFCGFSICFNSCKSKEKVAKYKTNKSIKENDLVENVLDNELIYNTLYFKKLNIDYEENGNIKSVKANMYLKRDSAIVISVIPIMGIEIFRISLDKKNIKIIDRLNRKVIVSDYSKVTDKFLVDVNYNVIEGFITNSLFSYPDYNPQLLKRYTAYHKDDFYILKSLNIRRFERISRRNSDMFVHELDILPEIYKVKNIIVTNNSSNISFNVEYNNFKDLSNTKFPYEVNISAKQGGKNFKLNFSFNEVIINSSNSLSFRIPDKYEVTSY